MSSLHMGVEGVGSGEGRGVSRLPGGGGGVRPTTGGGEGGQAKGEGGREGGRGGQAWTMPSMTSNATLNTSPTCCSPQHLLP
jgi:hypothetical protein